MKLDIEKLENREHLPAGRIRARCPACAASGGDTTGNHLLVFADGRFGCAVHPGDHQHRSEIYRLAGTRQRSTPRRWVDVKPKPGWR